MEDKVAEVGERQGEDAISRVFPCLFCSRNFYSFQALWGHQNIHKKVLGGLTPQMKPANFINIIIIRKAGFRTPRIIKNPKLSL